MEDSEETSQSLQIDLGPLQSDQQTPSSQDGQGKGDDVIVIDSDDEDDDEENDGEHEVSLVLTSSRVHQLSSCSHFLNSPSSAGAPSHRIVHVGLELWTFFPLPECRCQSQCFKSLVLLKCQLASSHSQSVSLDYRVFLLY